MRHLMSLLAIIVLATTGASASDVIPGAPQNGPVVLLGGTIYPVNGEPIDNGVLVFEEGKITDIARGADRYDPPAGATIVQCAGKRIYPGLFEASDQIGLVEISAVRATVDDSEAGSVNPNAQAHVSVNPDSELIPTTRANGVLLAHVLPEGGLISGQGAVMMMDGWTYEEMTLAAPTGIHLNWPNMLPRQSWRITATPEEQLRERDEALQRIEDLFDEAERYRLAMKAVGFKPAVSPQVATSPSTQPVEGNAEFPDHDAKLEAMIPLLDDDIPLLVSADEASQIQAAVAFAKRRGLKLILLGAADAGKCVELLKENDVPVILSGTHRLPGGRDEAYDEPFALPAKLHEAGIRFAIASNRSPAFARNLPYHVATAVAFGLPEPAALASMTLAPAEILGVGDRVGSLEKGKDATLFIADGDILETPTQVTHAWIQGRAVDLSSRHTQLNEKYKRRYGQE